MPFRTANTFLTVEGSRMRDIDPQDPENLHGMWSVFSKCAGSLEDGKRLEYMSWRLWNHQTVIRTSTSDLNCSPTNPLAIPRRPSVPATNIPDLSSSVESMSEEESVRGSDESLRGSGHLDESSSFSDLSPQSHRDHKHGREKHINPVDLENLVTSIKCKQELKDPIPTPNILRHTISNPMPVATTEQPSSPTPRGTSPRPVESSTSTVATNITESQVSPSGTSDTSANSDHSQHSVVRGFQPGGTISTYRSSTALAPTPAPILKSSKREIPSSKRRAGMFSIGAGSSGEDESSFRDNMSPRKSVSIDSEIQTSPKKHASFHDKIFQIGSPLRQSLTDNDGAIESEDEDEDDDDDYSTEEEVSESAIDDEDDWEDEADNEADRPLTFGRIDSKPNLTTRKSLITDKVHEGQRATALQSAAARTSPNLRRSRTSTPNGPSMPASPEQGSPLSTRNPQQQSQQQDSRTPPIIMTTSNTHPPCPPAFSPRTTRRNMLAVELDIDLRKNMLVERQQKNYYSHGGLPRRHTSNDVKNIKEFPDAEGTAGAPQQQQRQQTRKRGSTDERSWNEYFDSGFSEYHQKGW